MIKEIIERSAILIALETSYPNGIEIKRIEAVVKAWPLHIDFLRGKGISIEVTNTRVFLKTPVSFNIYQSIPPEIRQNVEDILWKILPKPQVLNETMVSQTIIQPIDEVVTAFIRKAPPSMDKIDANDIKWLVREDDMFPIACIHCADAACLTYGIRAFGPTDKLPELVCPANAVKQSPEGLLNIDKVNCSGCMLCIVRCPIDAIFYRGGVAVKREYVRLPERDTYVKEVRIEVPKKKEITKAALSKLMTSTTPFKLQVDIKEILDNFENKISRMEMNWSQDPYYVFARNCFRELGLKAFYTGYPGKLRRSDVTITEPFAVGIEVKSPAEGDISIGALRQAVHARMEVIGAYHSNTANTYAAAIGHDIGTRVHAEAKRWLDTYGVKIPLIRSRYLLYLVLKHKTDLPQESDRDLRRLFSDFYGWFGREELWEYFKVYFQIRKNEIIRKQHITIPMPPKVIVALEERDRNEAAKALEHLEKATFKEIERCFPDPERKARGGYALK